MRKLLRIGTVVLLMATSASAQSSAPASSFFGNPYGGRFGYFAPTIQKPGMKPAAFGGKANIGQRLLTNHDL